MSDATLLIACIWRDRLLLDLRTVFEDQDDTLARAFERLSGRALRPRIRATRSFPGTCHVPSRDTVR